MSVFVHPLLFLIAALAIVIVTAFVAHPHDGAAWRSVPRRAGVFVGACLGVVLVIWVLGRTLAALG
jgi:hypothetical protein